MKKILKSFGVVVGLLILQSIVSIVSQLGYTIFYLNINNIPVNRESIIGIQSQNIYISMLIANTIMLLILLLIFLVKKESFVKRCRFKPISLKSIIYISMLGIGIAFANLIFTSLLTLVFPSYKEVSNGIVSTNSSYIGLFYLVIAAPVFEEIFFRGVIFGYLRKNFNIVISIIIQALVFGIAHGNIVQSTYTSILGIILGIVYIATDSLWGAMLLHIVFNILGVVGIPYLISIFPNISLIVIVLISLIFIFIPTLKLLRKHKLNNLYVSE